VTAPVVVDPAPPDLATGLEALAAAARMGSGQLVLVAADLTVHPEALADLADDPRPVTAALVSHAPAAEPDLRVRAGRVLAVATPAHRVTGADTAFAGALRLGAGDRAAAAAAADELAGLASRNGWVGDPLQFLLLGLVRGTVRVGAISLDPWPWRRGPAVDGTPRQPDLDAMDERSVHAVRFARATKSEDGFVATFVSRPLSRVLTPWVLRVGLTPNQVTAVSVVVGLAAAALFAVGEPAALVAGALLLQLSLVLDCVDGDVARYTRRFSPMGAWLDASTDRLKEFACYAGLAWGSGAGRTGWLLAAAMIALQTARHSVDYTFTAVRELREADVVHAALDDPDDPARRAVGDERAARAIELSRRSSAGSPAVTWLKKVLHLGIGERWMVISLLAAAGRPAGALLTLLVMGAGSLLYTSVGRTLRARSWPAEPTTDREREIVLAQVDGGPLLPDEAARRIAGRPDGQERFLWVRPALLRAGEYAGVLALTALLTGTGPGAATCVLLLVVASHHYDDLYRVLNGLHPPGATARLLGLGWPGRLLVVAVLSLLGGPVGEGGLWVLAAGLGMLYLVIEPARVMREVRSRLEVPTGGAAGG
jgi:phosphatidylglycerophosphate synthase